MISLPFGTLIMIGLLAFTMRSVAFETIINPHALALVFLGTFGVFAISTPLTGIAGLFRALLKLRKSELSVKNLNKNLLDLSRRKDIKLTKPHPLIAYAQELWEEGSDSEIFSVLLAQRLDELNGTTEQAVATMRNLAKYPPALGMTGTVIGLVSLFAALTPETRDRIGPSLALAMMATFYGLVLANAVLMPLSDRLHILHLSNSKMNEHVFQTLLLIHTGEPPQDMIDGEADAA